ncbi:hypothetical protein EmuJ_000354200 [Echinococcus multilocularis]|uniref:Uncharacterized protein n=1 Tax=Echinococcus multilocularis TaxID=6211 RepID=A0A068XVR7_ECHMU|nr:hypothetical protein EmuJ_000354200 [Echinococcus multilocularis]
MSTGFAITFFLLTFYLFDLTGCCLNREKCIPYRGPCDLRKPMCCGRMWCVNDGSRPFLPKFVGSCLDPYNDKP